ncbi:MAG: hypothetical protein JOZ49_04290 [Mycolicibacterium sp.]|nr:hypothetical protein [Mycolicibacterium sp.]
MTRKGKEYAGPRRFYKAAQPDAGPRVCTERCHMLRNHTTAEKAAH